MTSHVSKVPVHGARLTSSIAHRRTPTPCWRLLLRKRSHTCYATAGDAESAASPGVPASSSSKFSRWVASSKGNAKDAKKLLSESYAVVKTILWPTLWVYLLSEVANVVLNRLTHRLVNQAFLMLHSGSGAYTKSQMGSLWYLCVNPVVTTFQSGYNYLSAAALAITFPIAVLISTVCLLTLYELAVKTLDSKPVPGSTQSATKEAESSSEPSPSNTPITGTTDSSKSAATSASTSEKASPTESTSSIDTLIASGQDESNNIEAAIASNGATESGEEQTKPKKSYLIEGGSQQSRFWSLKAAASSLKKVLGQHIKPVYMTGLTASVVERTMAMLSVFVVTLPFTTPRLLGIQLATAISRFEGLKYREAVRESQKRLKGHKWPIGLALAVAFFAQPFFLQSQAILVQLMPVRIHLQVPEISVGLALGAYYVKFVLFHVQVLLPLIVYRQLSTIDAST